MELSDVRSVFDVIYFFNIRVRDNKNRDTVEFIQWSGLRWELRQKYDWYFKYRAALLQVKYPKHIVECVSGNEPAQGKTLKALREDKLRAKRSKITQFKNKLQQAETRTKTDTFYIVYKTRQG
jgi:hypothetical protein